MSPLPHQITNSSFSMAPTTTPAVRPFSTMHSGSKVVTDSAQRKLDRKRANARIRQQRCRARKRARQLEEEAKSFEVASNNKKAPDLPKQPLPPIKKPEDSTSAANGKSQGPVLPGATSGARYWQPPPLPHPFRKPMTKNIHKLAKVPPSIANANAWKPPPSSSQSAAAYNTAAYYAHHHAYGMPNWYGAWSQQQAAAAYYGRPMHVTNHHAAGYPHTHHPAMTNTGLAPKLPPTSPLQLLSPMRNESQTQPTEATTPYHEVEDIVKSPMRPLPDVVSTPVHKDKRSSSVSSSPDTDLLPPLWSTCTKPTPATTGYGPRSPWSDHLTSPSTLMSSSTPAPDVADWNFSSLGYHDTPCLPTTTPVKTSIEMDPWHHHHHSSAAGAAGTPTIV